MLISYKADCWEHTSTAEVEVELLSPVSSKRFCMHMQRPGLPQYLCGLMLSVALQCCTSGCFKHTSADLHFKLQPGLAT